MDSRQTAFARAAEGIVKNLEMRGMEGQFFEDSASMVQAVTAQLPENCSVSWGGSESLRESGLMDALRRGPYRLIDRTSAATPEEQRRLYGETVMSDYFFCSTNAITLDGELVNIDGNGNRVACLIHGPAHVMLVVGMNKLTKDLDSAFKRVRTQACPPNAVRLHMQTPCALTGKCADCLTPSCFCNQIVVTRRSRHPGRIRVFLVAQDLGY